MRTAQSDKPGLLYFVLGAFLALLVWGLQMAGVTINLPLSAVVLAIAFFLVVYAFWIWEKPQKLGLFLRIVTVSIAGVIYFALIGNQLLSQWRNHSHEAEKITPQVSGLSFPFVLGGPLGDNDSPEWLMLVHQYGSSPAYNCDISFYDLDRKNIERLWLTRHSKSSFPPSNLTGGPSQIRHLIAESDPMGEPYNFRWMPLDANRQHYSASITTRSGDFSEDWEVTRVEGILRTKLIVNQLVQKQGQSPKYEQVFECSDQGFVAAPLVSKMPKVWPPPRINPGWKPNHTFDFPTLIIDPNGNIEALTMHSRNNMRLSCWSLLTTHSGPAAVSPNSSTK